MTLFYVVFVSGIVNANRAFASRRTQLVAVIASWHRDYSFGMPESAVSRASFEWVLRSGPVSHDRRVQYDVDLRAWMLQNGRDPDALVGGGHANGRVCVCVTVAGSVKANGMDTAS